MKKVVSFLLVFVLLFSALAIYAFASTKDHSIIQTISEIGNVTECEYVVEDKKINVSGNIAHEFLIEHSRYYIALYAIPYGVDYLEYLYSSQAVQLTKSDISVKFEFSLKVEKDYEKFATYCVVAISEEGDIIPVDTPKLPIVKTNIKYVSGNKDAFKGVQTHLTSTAVSANVSSSIVPVHLERLLSNSSVGHIYSMHGTYLYFDNNYIAELDARVRSLTASGASVYLRFLLDGNDSSVLSSFGASGIPDMSDQKNVDLLMAFTDFLTDRYNDRYLGTIKGIILGSNVDSAFDRSGTESVSAYTENYFRYMTIVSGVANQIVNTIDITIPLSNVDSYSTATFDGGCAPSDFLERICSMLDERFVSQFNFSTLIETDLLPYGLSEEVLESGKLNTVSGGGLSADKAWIFSQYINDLRTEYKNVPSSYIFLWNVRSGLSYKVLSTAYAYSYFKLMADASLSSFVVSFENEEMNNEFGSFPMISDIIKKIDTADSFNITKNQLRYLNADSWYAVISDMYNGNFNRYELIALNRINELPNNMLGSYAYVDFSYQTDTSSWFGGSHCDNLKIDYSKVSGRTLQAHFNDANLAPSEYSELYCSYEYYENFIYTPYLFMNFSIENDEQNKNELYEVKVSYASKAMVAETSVVCAPYENIELIIDLNEHIDKSMIEYIVIGVRCLSSDDSGYTLCFSSLDGYSAQFVSDELSSLIAEERLRIQNMLKDSAQGERKHINTVLLVAGGVTVAFVIGIGIFMCFKRDDTDDEELE